MELAGSRPPPPRNLKPLCASDHPLIQQGGPIKGDHLWVEFGEASFGLMPSCNFLFWWFSFWYVSGSVSFFLKISVASGWYTLGCPSTHLPRDVDSLSGDRPIKRGMLCPHLVKCNLTIRSCHSMGCFPLSRQ